MPVKIKITIWFTIISALLLALVCSTVYYVADRNRTRNIKTRLLNRAITTARLLNEGETFNQAVIAKIDSLTASALKHKTVQAYTLADKKVYQFSDDITDTIEVTSDIIRKATRNGTTYFESGNRDAIGYFDAAGNMVMISAAYDESGKNNLSQLFFILITACIGGILIASISGFIFSNRLLLPVKKIADEVNEISAQNLTNRIPAGNINDEWFYLADTLNKLLNRLQESFELQRRFISNASHELSTPLTAISSQLEISLQKERSAGEYKHTMQSVYEDVQHLNQLTKSLLEFAKAAGSTTGIELHNFRIDEVLLRIPYELTKANTAFNVVLDFESLPSDENQLIIFGNEELLFTAIKNITLNACKYSPSHQAMVKLVFKNRSSHVYICDDGPGIAPEDLQRIFEPFFRSEATRAIEGAGLGLSLAQRIIKLHKGEIMVRSGSGGTQFEVVLPAAG